MQLVQLEPESVALLREIADAARSAPRDKREFMVLPHLGGCSLMGPGDRATLSEAERRDIDDLVAANLLRIRRRGRHEYSFTVTPEAYAYLATLDEGEPLKRVETEVTATYMEAAAFRSKYPIAYQRWKEAADLLWGPAADTEMTTIGHKTREAVQEFASALVGIHQIADAPPDPAKTVARLQAVVDSHRERLGEARRHLLDALIAYWGEVNDLLQRQEHGGQKEGEPLAWEDGRRAVFQTAIVMYEIDRTI